MMLKNRLFDAMLDGKLGTSLVVTRQELRSFILDVTKKSTGAFLSNWELATGVLHCATWTAFTQRLARGKYRVHPSALAKRLRERTKKPN